MKTHCEPNGQLKSSDAPHLQALNRAFLPLHVKDRKGVIGLFKILFQSL